MGYHWECTGKKARELKGETLTEGYEKKTGRHKKELVNDDDDNVHDDAQKQRSPSKV